MSKRRKRKRNRLLNLQLSTTANFGEPVKENGEPRQPSSIQAIGYGPEKFHQQDIGQPEEIRELIGKWPVLWINVSGTAQPSVIHTIGDIFLLHELALEDVMHIHQRAKVEPYGDYVFIVMRTARLDQGSMTSDQLSMFMGKGFLITFEPAPGDFLNLVRDRIAKGAGHIRSEQEDYLVYTIIDSIVDGFFPIVEATGDALENLEDEIVERTDRYTPAKIHELKRDIVNVRRAIWPSRDALAILLREDTTTLLSSRTRLYMRDCYDHALRIMDLVETQREMCSDLMDLYLSSVSNRMNQIMKLLTLVTLVFMPPTLIAGIYGMNFKIPEYSWQDGYIYALVIMFISASLVFLWARRNGWLKDESKLS